MGDCQNEIDPQTMFVQRWASPKDSLNLIGRENSQSKSSAQPRKVQIRKCSVYLHLPWQGIVLTRLGKQKRHQLADAALLSNHVLYSHPPTTADYQK